MSLTAFKAEIAHKRSQLEKLDKLVEVKRKKLANENFVRRAPEAVVQKERDRLTELETQRWAVKTVVEKLARNEKELEELDEDIAAKKEQLATLNAIEQTLTKAQK